MSTHAEQRKTMDYRAIPNYSLSYDLGSGAILAVDIKGHGHDIDTIELLLEAEIADQLEREGATSWDITESWRP